MPKTITVEIKCITTGCDSVLTFHPEHEIAPAPMVAPSALRGWLTLATASQQMAQHDYLCPKCSALLPPAALAALRRQDDELEAQRTHWAEQQQALEHATAAAPAPLVEHDAEPLPGGWSAANVETKLLGLLDAALNDAGHDVDRAARAILARFEATPDEEKRACIEAIASALVRVFATVPAHIKTQIVTLALSFQAAPRAAHVPASLYQQHAANGVIRG
jgi:hypothetical protein